MTHLAALRAALLDLKATGPKGFEGLLATVLSTVCQQPFRLASSGSQRGRDGDSAFDQGATYFEGKLYDGKIPKTAIAVKLMDLKADNQGQVDTLILGATSEIGALNAQDFLDAAAADGIGLVLLDWSDTAIPPLATAVAMAGQTAKDFLRANLTKPAQTASLTGAIAAIDHLVGLQEFAPLSAKLKDMLCSPSVGLGLAKKENRNWLQSVFSNRIIARQHFGQPLAPSDPSGLSVQPREKLRASLRLAFAGPPDNSVFAVIGEEGAGKSWLVADSWQTSIPASVLAVATADELRNPDDLQGLEDFLIRIVIRETGDVPSAANQTRWRRRFEGWRANPNPANVRITLWIDGLDQTPDFPWPRWIDAASLLLEDLGGQLVVTTRSVHFARLRNALVSKVQRIIVSDWTSDELTSILNTRDINANVLSADVFNTLRNPRILGIAVGLLDASDIENMQELSVGRLLFEHLRLSDIAGTTRLPAAKFAKALQELANDIVGRLKVDQQDDLRLFDVRLDDRLSAVSSSRFFKPVGDDPDVYEVGDEGLQLALGLWLVSALEFEVRNDRDPSARLGAILEPITALDITADVVASAVEVACLRDPCPVAVASAVIRHYVGLQNLPEGRREAFASLVKKAPDAFVRAAEDAALSSEHVSNVDWLTFALLRARDDSFVWPSISSRLSEWLSFYSLTPERMMASSPSRDPQEKVAEEREKRQADIEKKVKVLSKSERRYLAENLQQVDEGNLESLHRLAFFLLAGMPLVGFAPALFGWAFSNALNSSIQAPYREFQHLIRFNFADWSVTRNALLELLRTFEDEGKSSVGEWTTIGILRATGELKDASRSEELAERLTKNRERIGSWRLIENYCSTDPCDPASAYPGNVGHTAEQYRELDQTKLCLGMGNSSEDHFFQMALTGLARFEPDAAVGVIRSLSENMLERVGLPRRQAVLALLPHSVVVERSIVDALVSAAQSSASDTSRNDSESRDDWLTAQYSMFLALPHLSANDQLAAIGGLQGISLLLNMMKTLRPADEQVVENWVVRAVDAEDEDMQIRILGALNFSSLPLSENSKAVVAKLMSAENKEVRAQALGIAASTADATLLRRLVESGWDAGLLNPDIDHYEIWYGSTILVSAAEAGILSIPEALNRMSLTHYGFAASNLGGDAASIVADRIGAALLKVMKLSDIPNLPDIESSILPESGLPPPLVSLQDDYAPTDIKSAFDMLAESNEDIDARQERAEKAYQRFSKELTDAEARLVLADFGFEGIAAVIAARPDVIGPWYDLIVAAEPQKKRTLHLFSAQLASALAKTDPTKAEALVQEFTGIEPLVRHVVGISKIPVEATSMWTNGTVPKFRSECLKRLDEADTDREIAVEVLAAFWASRGDVIAEYVDDLLSTEEPARVSRALMVTGFSDQNDHADAILNRYRGSVGFIGNATRAAQYAYERNVWARYWYDQMVTATEPTDFWRFSVLFTKVVDGRIALWEASTANASDMFLRFFPTIESEIKRRIKKWQDSRRDKLFGDKAPHGVFLN